MNVLHFLKIRYKNFLSTGNLFTEIDLSAVNMTLIVGSNGDGKSTMIDAITFALFNKPFRKINKPQLLNSITKKELVVEIEFVARGNSYKIVRGIKPAVFEIWKNGEMIDQAAANIDYQEQLEKNIIRTNFKTFSQIVILGSASYVPFMQLKPMDRRSIVEDLYDLRLFSTMNGLLSKRLSGAEKDINRLENERDMLVQKLTLSKQHQGTMAQDKQKWIEQKNLEISEIIGKIHALGSQVRFLELQNEESNPLLKEFGPLNKKMRDMGDIRAGILQNVASIEKEINWLNHSQDCPTCKQHIAEEFKTSAIAEKDARLTEVKDGLSKLQVMYKEVCEQQFALQEIDQAYQKNKTQIIILTSEITTRKSAISKLEREITQLENEHEEVVDEATITELESEIIEKKQEWAKLKTQADMMGYVNILLKDDGIKAKIIKKYSGTFNELANSYLAMLDFFVDFHLDEKFEEVIKSRGRDNFSYHSFSEGEKLRIDLAVLFAWRDVAKKRASLNTNLLIMDEIFDGSLDTQGVEELLVIMKKVIKKENVFVISHQTDRLSDKFDRTLQFSKTKGFSKLVVPSEAA
jgi:DNA repair exonuclease SbcCD ATPase subunit